MDIRYIESINSLATRYSSVRCSYIEHSKQLIGPDLFLEDFFFVASIDKGIRLLDGILPILENRNITCGAILYRAQIDLCARTYAAFIAEDPQELIKGYIDGGLIRNYKSRDGNKLTDGYLRKQLDLKCPGLSESYAQASDFVHFSPKAFNLIAKADEGYCVSLGIGVEHDKDIDATLLDLGEAALTAAGLHMRLIEAVIESQSKENVALAPDEL